MTRRHPLTFAPLVNYNIGIPSMHNNILYSGIYLYILIENKGPRLNDPLTGSYNRRIVKIVMAKDLECNVIIDLYRLSESIKSLKLNIILFIMCIYRVTGNKLVVIILCIITRELLLIFGNNYLNG